MALFAHPKIGDVLICEFPACLREPEMIKARPVIILTARAGLCTVIPLSTKEPRPLMEWHIKIEDRTLPNTMVGTEQWAKCDMVYVLSNDRLDRIKTGKNRATGKRTYETGRISVETLLAVKTAVKLALRLHD